MLECVAEGVGFEPTSPFGEAVFKTAALGHSAIPPQSLFMPHARWAPLPTLPAGRQAAGRLEPLKWFFF